MQTDLSNQVIARTGEKTSDAPRRTLDLGNIHTPELGLLSPRRSEIAPRGVGRDAALIAYSERLRQSYRTNEGGIRDGMLKLGEAFRDGQTINVSCFCRAGQICHADVVKMAIEKVGRSLIHEAAREKAPGVMEKSTPDLPSNPRTARAINEILSVGRSELVLAKLEDTEGRNRSEHASHLNGHSQWVRDLYERGATVRNGVLISPKENPSSSLPLAVTTNAYAVNKLSKLVSESRAKELAPQIVEYGQKIAGATADRDTKIKVFNWLYEALEGRSGLLNTDERVSEAAPKEERFERTLNEIASLAEEMSKLEPSDRSVPVEQLIEFEGNEKEQTVDDPSHEKAYEDEISPEEHVTLIESDHIIGGTQEFERVQLEDTTLSQFANEMSKKELDRWIDVRLPVLDELLESGTPVDEILKPFQKNLYHATKEGTAEKQSASDDLKFASAYIERQLKQPESRLRHFNTRYRNYAAMLETATSRDEVTEAASKIRLENAKVGSQWKTLPEAEKAKTPPPLSQKEMQFLFTEASPRHYTSEMTAAKLSYMSVGNDARTKTEALLRGEISPSPEAAQLIESLESRLGRRQLKDSVSATKHFLQSLKTPNAELRYKNEFDHSEIYRKLPPAERDFVYQRSVLQKESLEKSLIERALDRQMPEPATAHKSPAMDFNAFREELKTRFTEFVTTNPKLADRELSEGVVSILETSLASNGLEGKADHESIKALSRELSEGLRRTPSRFSANRSTAGIPVPERIVDTSNRQQNRIPDMYSR
ncbi:MAG TPA: hypothetical protein PKD26_16080 [Pyrinomonadaceae bacterium]|nr:hypothetical protein [Pyrinomonadaceae bacterium]